LNILFVDFQKENPIFQVKLDLKKRPLQVWPFEMDIYIKYAKLAQDLKNNNKNLNRTRDLAEKP